MKNCEMPEKQIKQSDLTKDFRPCPTAAQIIGKRFGRLLVTGYAGSKTRIDCHGRKKRSHFVVCRCDCGISDIANPHHLIHGLSKSCGCLRVDLTTERLTKHGFAPLHGYRKKIYKTWQGMNSRCHNPNNSRYQKYGGRGISVCDRWKGAHGFENFLSDLGEPSKELSLERKNVNGNYEPANCCWIPLIDQAKNRNHNWKVNVCGVVMTARDAGRKLGLGRSKIVAYLKKSGKSKTDVHEIAPILASFGLKK
jgi:hypothetical protein